MNPLGSGTNTTAVPLNPTLQNLAETLRFAKSFRNPSAFIQYVQKNNPEMARQLVQVAQTIKNPSAVAQQLMAQQGITPDQIQAILGQI